MIRLSRLSGLPVVLDGRIVGHVEQAVLTPDASGLRGLVLRKGLGSAKWADAAAIRLIGSVSVIISRPPEKPPGDADFALSMVRDTGGMILGRVTDVFVNEALETSAVEVSLGFLETIRHGRMLARRFALSPSPDDPGQVLIPCGASLERLSTSAQARR